MKEKIYLLWTDGDELIGIYHSKEKGMEEVDTARLKGYLWFLEEYEYDD